MRYTTYMQKQSILDVHEIKSQVDDYISALITQRTEAAKKTDPAYGTLWQEISRVYAAGGKRIRPYLTYLAFSAYTKQPIDAVLPALAAQELIHQAMLMHDDIIDRDTVRHNTLNISGSYNNIYAHKPYACDSPHHFANSVALLAGDLLISEAYLLVARQISAPRAIDILHRAIFRVIGGELLDTEASFRRENPPSPAVIAEEKTASYSFVSPLTMGAALAGASDSEIAKLEIIGRNVGIAYQMQDDILGVFGNESITGKSTTSDLREGKRTGLIERYLTVCSSKEREKFLKIFGKKQAKDSDFISLRDAMRQSGVLEAEEEVIDQLGREAITVIESLEIDEAARTALLSTLKSFQKRAA